MMNCKTQMVLTSGRSVCFNLDDDKINIKLPIIFWKTINKFLIGNHHNIFSVIWYFASNIYLMLGCINGCVNIFCFFYIFYTLSLRRQFASYVYYSHITIKKSWGMKNKSGVYLVAFYASNGTKCFAVVLLRDTVEPLKTFMKIIWNLTKKEINFIGLDGILYMLKLLGFEVRFTSDMTYISNRFFL